MALSSVHHCGSLVSSVWEIPHIYLLLYLLHPDHSSRMVRNWCIPVSILRRCIKLDIYSANYFFSSNFLPFLALLSFLSFLQSHHNELAVGWWIEIGRYVHSLLSFPLQLDLVKLLRCYVKRNAMSKKKKKRKKIFYWSTFHINE